MLDDSHPHSPMSCSIPGFPVLNYQPLLRLMPIESMMPSNHLMLCMFPQFVVINIVKGFGIVNKAEVNVFLELSRFFNDSTDTGNLISGSSAFSKSSLKFVVHVLLKPGLENFEHYLTSVWDECNCVVVWAFFGIAFLWDWSENWPFPVLLPKNAQTTTHLLSSHMLVK